MNIVLENIGRRFNKEWIFRNVSLSFSLNDHVAVTGANGSGKSTFLQLLSGYLIPSEGTLRYSDSSSIDPGEIYKRISFASPALELFEDLTLEETIRFHFRLKNSISDVKTGNLPEILQLHGNEKKQVKNFSSGMKQRVKIGLAVLSDTPVLLLDEPTSNLDKNGILWYRGLMEKYTENRMVFVASNKVEDDYFFCRQTIEIEKYK